MAACPHRGQGGTGLLAVAAISVCASIGRRRFANLQALGRRSLRLLALGVSMGGCRDHRSANTVRFAISVPVFKAGVRAADRRACGLHARRARVPRKVRYSAISGAGAAKLSASMAVRHATQIQSTMPHCVIATRTRRWIPPPHRERPVPHAGVQTVGSDLAVYQCRTVKHRSARHGADMRRRVLTAIPEARVLPGTEPHLERRIGAWAVAYVRGDWNPMRAGMCGSISTSAFGEAESTSSYATMCSSRRDTSRVAEFTAADHGRLLIAQTPTRAAEVTFEVEGA